MDEVFIRIQGVQHSLWRAVDQDGVVLDILAQARRDPGSKALLQMAADEFAI
jgi:transposase-like protein